MELSIHAWKVTCQSSLKKEIFDNFPDMLLNRAYTKVGGVALLVERRSLTGELSLSCARPAADG